MVILGEKMSRSVNLSLSAYFVTGSFYSCRADRLDRKVDRCYSEWTTNERTAGWITG